MSPAGTLKEGLKTLGLAAGAETLGLFDLYLSELKKWSRVYSITSIRDDRDIVVNHFLDSAIYLKGLGPDARTVADIGSGGGFPGVPMKILRPELEMHLVEPTGKKASFLRMLVRRLGLKGVTVHESRMDGLGDLKVDAAVTRALFSAIEFHDGALALVRQGGVMLLSKGPRYEEELEGADFSYEVMDVLLPFSDAMRHIIVIRR